MKEWDKQDGIKTDHHDYSKKEREKQDAKCGRRGRWESDFACPCRSIWSLVFIPRVNSTKRL